MFIFISDKNKMLTLALVFPERIRLPSESVVSVAYEKTQKEISKYVYFIM